MKSNEIIDLLPYARPFLFVDGIDEVSDEGIRGHYRFREEEPYYAGHFVDHPVTPGVILTECMAQIGLVCLGIYMLRERDLRAEKAHVALTSHEMNFYKPVYPGEQVQVISEKEVYRLNKLKCKVKMYNGKQELVARGKISGMLIV